MAELIAAVFAKDPERPGAKPRLFRPGDDVPERFWPRLSRNPALWKDGKPPTPTGQDDDNQDTGKGDGTEPQPGPDAEPEQATLPPHRGDEEPAKKPAARKAATKPATRRKAADQGTGGQ